MRVDIAVNLTDPMFQGVYRGQSKHPGDLKAVLGRARDAGVEKLLITGTSLSDSKAALELAKKTSSSQFFRPSSSRHWSETDC